MQSLAISRKVEGAVPLLDIHTIGDHTDLRSSKHVQKNPEQICKSEKLEKLEPPITG